MDSIRQGISRKGLNTMAAKENIKWWDESARLKAKNARRKEKRNVKHKN